MDRPEFVPAPAEFEWALKNIFSLSDLEALAHEHPEAAAFWEDHDCKQFVEGTAHSREIPPGLEDRIQRAMEMKMSMLQRADRDYWKKIISELRALRTEGLLLPEGALV
jgi:hypothetical protein